MSFRPKQYQTDALAALEKYLAAARLRGPARAFTDAILDLPIIGKQEYRAVQGLEDSPYVCLRLPTGGGKTYLAACSVKAAAGAFLERDYPLVIWMVPTNTIREQTLKTLTTPGQPNREALMEAFDNRVRILDMADFAELRPQDIRDRACIVIGTIATSRVNETELRKVYAHSEELEPHLSSIPPNAPGLEVHAEGPDAGKIKYSFMNLLAWHRPLVIVDEAHNAKSKLSLDVLRRMRPACILEFTATPADDSNILHHVTAATLKKEYIVKLPIMLTETTTWQESIHDAIQTRRRLEQLSADEPDYIRPILLIQAENKDRAVNVEVVEKYLVEDEGIERRRIAIATGNQRELDDVDLMKPDCPVEIVVTVEALKEGWDCPFAYVFCSVATVHSPKDVEQLLGRVLRMPYARERKHPDLNRAYALVSNAAWPNAISQMRDRLVSMGFDQVEARKFVQEQPPLPGGIANPALPPRSVEITTTEMPTLFGLTEEDRAKVQITPDAAGAYRVAVTGPISEQSERALLAALPEPSRRVLAEKLDERRQQIAVAAQQVQATPFAVPRLCVRVQGQLELADAETLLPPESWNLLDFPAELSPEEFTVRETADAYEIDVKGDHLTMRHLGQQAVLNLNDVPTTWTDLHLGREITSAILQDYVRFPVLSEFVRKTIRHLIERRGIPLATLVRLRFPLQKVMLDKLARCRDDAQSRAYQQMLFAPDAAVETSFDYSFPYDPDNYAPPEYYHGPFQFTRHYYPDMVGAFDNDEEFECARAIDQHPQVKRWVRNVPPNDQSFSLPRAHGNFYPDFVGELLDGRVFIVEYKGEHLLPNAQQDKNVGELWAARSKGRAIFLMAVARDDFGRDVRRQVADMIEKGK